MKPTSYVATGRYLLYVLITALLIGISGCGSGGSGSSSSGSGSGSTASGSAQ